MFGEMALLTKKPRAASVVAVAATTCAVLSREDFERVMREHPGVALGVAAAFAERLDRANERAGVDYVNLARSRSTRGSSRCCRSRSSASTRLSRSPSATTG